MAEDRLQLFGGDWTERKLDALDRYLRAYATALKNQPFERVYLDAFAGTGYRQQRAARKAGAESLFSELAEPEPQEFLDGSARIALRVEPPFHRYIFIESHRRRAAELVRLKKEFPERASAIDVRRKDANVSIRDVCRVWDRDRSRGVLFLDPFGMQVEWATVRAVAKTESIDVWILFPFAVNRLLMSDPKKIPLTWQRRLTLVLGTDQWVKHFYETRQEQDIFGESSPVSEKRLTLEGLGTFYRELLRGVFPVVAENPAVLRNTRNVPLFQLFFAAGNPGRGGEIALRIAAHILTKI